MKFIAKDFDTVKHKMPLHFEDVETVITNNIVSPEILEIINDAENYEEIYSLCNIDINFEKLKNAVVTCLDFNKKQHFYNIDKEFILLYILSLANVMITDLDIKRYCMMLGTIKVLTDYMEKLDEV